MRRNRLVSVAALFLISAAVNARARTDEIFMAGAWARSPADCARPELIFSEHRLAIVMDADGQPIEFVYPDLTYQSGARKIEVTLGKPHPYSKTADKNALEFKQITPDVVELQKSKGRNTKFFRCAK